ncbi:MAG: T9SS type A sorting domain-containing protein [Bacteroidota bacterium]
MKKIIVMLSLLTMVVNVQSQSFLKEPVFAYNSENYRFNQYLHFTNAFETAYVYYLVGEFKLISDSDETRIYIKPDLAEFENRTLKGSSEQGINYDLMPYSRTETFRVPEIGHQKISFFREMKVNYDPCDPDEFEDENDDYDLIADHQEFVLRIVDAEIGETIDIIDSVGVTQHNAIDSTAKYGTSPNTAWIVRDIPEAAYGRDVYLEVVPKRWGQTPYGMVLKLQSYQISQTAWVDSLGTRHFWDDYWEYLQNEWWTELNDYADSHFQQHGVYPEIRAVPSLYNDEFKSKFLAGFVEDTTIDGKKFFLKVTKIDSGLTKKRIHDLNSESSGEGLINVLEIFPNPVTREIINANILANVSEYINIYLFDFSSKTKNHLYQGSLDKGINRITLHLPDISSGTYFLTFTNSLDENVYSEKIQIVR